MKIYFTFYIFVFYLGNLYANSNDLEIKKLAELIHLEKVRIEQAKLNWAYEKKQIEFQIKIAKGELNVSFRFARSFRSQSSKSNRLNCNDISNR